MTLPAINEWIEANQRYLTAALTGIRRELERHAGTAEPGTADPETLESREMAAEMPAPPALETLCALFGLSSFERSTLLLCAGVELDAAFPTLCAAAQGDAGRPHATFGLALAALPHPHWSALSPAAPLRRWRLVEVDGDSLTRSPLRIDERVLHYLSACTTSTSGSKGSWSGCRPPMSCCLHNRCSPGTWPGHGPRLRAARCP